VRPPPIAQFRPRVTSLLALSDLPLVHNCQYPSSRHAFPPHLPTKLIWRRDSVRISGGVCNRSTSPETEAPRREVPLRQNSSSSRRPVHQQFGRGDSPPQGPGPAVCFAPGMVPNTRLAPMRARLGRKLCELRMMLSRVIRIFLLNDQVQRSVAIELEWLQHVELPRRLDSGKGSPTAFCSFPSGPRA
jgi:hypothetical protein